MKKLLLLAGIAFAGLAQAQSSFLVTDPHTGMAASSHYYLWVGASDPTVTIEFGVTNTSANTVKSKVHQTVITNTVGQDLYFCYGINCYSPGTFYSGQVNLAAGQSLPYTQGPNTYYGIRTDFDANGVLGISTVQYTVYDSLNHNDSVNITITYNVTANSIRNNSNVFVSNASPNPASNNINFSYELNGATQSMVKFYNSVGVLVRTVNLMAGTKSTQVDVSSLEEGFYFYTVLADGKVVNTRRLVIAR